MNPKIIATAVLYCVEIAACALMLVLVVGVLREHWWPAIPAMSYHAAFAVAATRSAFRILRLVNARVAKELGLESELDE